MSYFYVKDGEAFIPEKINPDLVKLSNAIIRTCKLNFKLQLKANALNNAIKTGKRERMLDIMQKCFEKNQKLYNDDMALTGVTIGEIDPAFFEDKEDSFLVEQLQVLADFAVINTVVESRLMAALSASCEKVLGTPLHKIKFFTNQQEILEVEEEEEETAEE